MGLKEQIEAWPEAMRAARLRFAEASSEFSEVDQALIQLMDRHTDLLERASERRQHRNIGRVPEAGVFGNEEARQRLQEAAERAQVAREEVNRAKAAADVQVRREADQAGKRLTESAVKAQVQIHPDVVAAEQHYRDLRAEAAAAREESYRQPWSAFGAGPDQQDQLDTADTAFDETLAAVSAEVIELQRQRAQLLGKLAFARAEVAYQRAVGKSLDMLTKLAVAGAKSTQ